MLRREAIGLSHAAIASRFIPMDLGRAGDAFQRV